MHYATPHPEVDKLLNALCDGIHGILGDRLAGLYLYGSLVTGDFDLAVSDIDLLAVVGSDLTEQEFAQLNDLHTIVAAAYPAWHDRIEIAYLAAGALKTYRTQASPIAVISPGEPFHFKEAGADWLINWWVVRGQGVALYGPPATALIDPIGDDEFLHAVREQVGEWQTWVYHMPQRKSQAYTILTMCRALYASVNGRQVSKRQAAEWAADRYPAWAPLIQNALIWRSAEEEAPVDHAATFPDTEAFVRFTYGEIVAQAG
jgi:hypothetical protein